MNLSATMTDLSKKTALKAVQPSWSKLFPLKTV